MGLQGGFLEGGLEKGLQGGLEKGGLLILEGGLKPLLKPPLRRGGFSSLLEKPPLLKPLEAFSQAPLEKGRASRAPWRRGGAAGGLRGGLRRENEA